MQPYFSIVIPVYNRADLISDTLLSVIEQSYTDFECVIVDDGSSDSDALQNLIRSLEDNRFHYIRQENGGACSARNTGIANSAGRYIAFLDSDDRFVTQKLETVRMITEADVEIDFFFSPVFVDRGVGKLWIKPPAGPRADQRIDEYITCTEGWIQTSAMVVKREVAESLLFDIRLPSSQDTDFAIRAFAKGHRFHYHEEPLTIFADRPDPKRISTQRNASPLIEWALRSVNDGVLSQRAYRGFLGWQCARITSYRSRIEAFRLFGGAALRGTYSPALATRIALQILLPKSVYQKWATIVVKAIGRSQ